MRISPYWLVLMTPQEYYFCKPTIIHYGKVVPKFKLVFLQDWDQSRVALQEVN